MLLTETIRFDSLKNYQGPSELLIKEGVGVELWPRPCGGYLHTDNYILQITIYLQSRNQCNGKISSKDSGLESSRPTLSPTQA